MQRPRSRSFEDTGFPQRALTLELLLVNCAANVQERVWFLGRALDGESEIHILVAAQPWPLSGVWGKPLNSVPHFLLLWSEDKVNHCVSLLRLLPGSNYSNCALNITDGNSGRRKEGKKNGRGRKGGRERKEEARCKVCLGLTDITGSPPSHFPLPGRNAPS